MLTSPGVGSVAFSILKISWIISFLIIPIVSEILSESELISPVCSRTLSKAKGRRTGMSSSVEERCTSATTI